MGVPRFLAFDTTPQGPRGRINPGPQVPSTGENVYVFTYFARDDPYQLGAPCTRIVDSASVHQSLRFPYHPSAGRELVA